LHKRLADHRHAGAELNGELALYQALARLRGSVEDGLAKFAGNVLP
jgi:hypothetical protein